MDREARWVRAVQRRGPRRRRSSHVRTQRRTRCPRRAQRRQRRGKRTARRLRPARLEQPTAVRRHRSAVRHVGVHAAAVPARNASRHRAGRPPRHGNRRGRHDAGSSPHHQRLGLQPQTHTTASLATKLVGTRICRARAWFLPALNKQTPRAQQTWVHQESVPLYGRMCYHAIKRCPAPPGSIVC